MQAVIHDQYGSLDDLVLRDIATPAIKDDEVLVRMRAAAVHVGDLFGIKGSPFAMRLVSGILRPHYGVPGFDVAGIVDAVGKNIRTLKPGDEVFGAGQGSCAEYVRAKESTLAPKPKNLSFAEAAAIPTSAVAALRGLRDTGKVQPGQRVLINGASGGVGTFAVQIAKAFGAEVSGVCGTKNVELVRSLGADQVIDYTAQDFTAETGRYDLILDNIENRSLAECRRALTPTGTLILNSGTGAEGLAMMVRLIKPLLLSPFVRQNLRRYVTFANRTDLLTLTQLVDAGQLKPIIDKEYPLAKTRDALRHVESGHVRGKIVVTI